MKAKVFYKTGIISEVIDLEDYGHDEDTKFEDLTEKERIFIEDDLRNQNYITVSVETINK